MNTYALADAAANEDARLHGASTIRRGTAHIAIEKRFSPGGQRFPPPRPNAFHGNGFRTVAGKLYRALAGS